MAIKFTNLIKVNKMSTILNNNGVEKTVKINNADVKLQSVFANVDEASATTNASLREKGVVKKIDTNNTIGSIFYELNPTSDNNTNKDKTSMDESGVVIKLKNKGATLVQVYY